MITDIGKSLVNHTKQASSVEKDNFGSDWDWRRPSKYVAGYGTLSGGVMLAGNAVRSGDLTGRKNLYYGTLSPLDKIHKEHGIFSENIRRSGLFSNPGEAMDAARRNAAIFYSRLDSYRRLLASRYRFGFPKIMQIHGPTWKTDNFKNGISPEYIIGSGKYKKNSMNEILQYAKNKPLRFAYGAGKGLAGTGLAIGGGYLMSDALRGDRE